MKIIALLIVVGVSCFLSGVIVSALWFRSQLPPTTQSAPENGTEPAFDESKPGGGELSAAGNGSARAGKFAALDTDQDGKLNLAEFSVGRPPAEASKWFGRRDADKDGFISKQEFLPISAMSETR